MNNRRGAPHRGQQVTISKREMPSGRTSSRANQSRARRWRTLRSEYRCVAAKRDSIFPQFSSGRRFLLFCPSLLLPLRAARTLRVINRLLDDRSRSVFAISRNAGWKPASKQTRGENDKFSRDLRKDTKRRNTRVINDTTYRQGQSIIDVIKASLSRNVTKLDIRSCFIHKTIYTLVAVLH